MLSTEPAAGHYDRRGRGESGDTPPYVPVREVEDLAALVETMGDSRWSTGIRPERYLPCMLQPVGFPSRDWSSWSHRFRMVRMKNLTR